MALSISPATLGDCAECTRLLVEQLREHDISVSAEPLQRVLEEAVADERRGFLLMARDDGKTAGVAYVTTILSAEHCGLAGWLEELYVVPDYRCRGVGTALVTAAMNRARQMGMVAMDLEVVAGHERVMSLYQRFGFQRLDRSRWIRKLL